MKDERMFESGTISPTDGTGDLSVYFTSSSAKEKFLCVFNGNLCGPIALRASSTPPSDGTKTRVLDWYEVQSL